MVPTYSQAPGPAMSVPLIFYAHSLAQGSPARQALTKQADESHVPGIWISLDPLGMDEGSPPGIIWLRLGETTLATPGLRNFLARSTKLAWALHALGPAHIWAWDRASAQDARLAGRICGTPVIRVGIATQRPPARTGKYRPVMHRLIELALSCLSPARARRMAAERDDPKGRLAQCLDPSHYRRQTCPALPGLAPQRHYLQAGQYAGLNPHPLFWQFWYARLFLKDQNGLTPWHHFLRQACEAPPGNDPNLYFSSSWYAAQAGALQQNAVPLLDYLEQTRRGVPPPAPNPVLAVLPHGAQAVDNGESPLVRFITQESHLARQLAATTLAEPASLLPLPPALVTAGQAVRIAVCTVLTGNYDPCRDLTTREEGVDYFLLTDSPPSPVPVGWQVIVVPSQHPPMLQSRYLKMNLLHHLPEAREYGAILYLDGNIELRGPVTAFLRPFLDSEAALGLIPHPFRRCVYDEAAAVLQQRRDVPENTHRTIAMLETAAFPPHHGLFEMNCFCFKPGEPSAGFLAEWWRLFQSHGARDQLLAPYIIWKQHLPIFPLMPQGMSVRTHPGFAYHGHHRPSLVTVP